MQIRFISWDFRTPPTADRLAEEIAGFTGGPIYATAIDDGSDDYILVLSDARIQAKEALVHWVAQHD
jgi:hypothetical protein